MRFLILSILVLGMNFIPNLYGQSEDSVKFNIYENYDSNLPPIEFNLDELPSPTLFILNNKKLQGERYSDLKIDKENMESIKIYQNKKTWKSLGTVNINQ